MIDLFGEDNYNDMLSDLVDYSGEPDWNDEATYVEDDIVCYEGRYYIAITNTTNNSAPSCNDEWIIAPKFETACNNTTFEKYKKMLAWKIYAEAAPFYPEVLSASGFTGTDSEYKTKMDYHLSFVYKGIAKMRKSFLMWNDKNGCITLSSCSSVETNQTSRTIMGY